MKILVSYALTVALVVSSSAPAFASAPPKNMRVENYFINPTVDFNWMTQEERAAYVSFLYSLQILIDAELSGDMVIGSAPTQTASTKLNLMLQLLQPVFTVQPAEAFFPLIIPVAEALVATGVRVMAPRAIAYAASRTAVSTAVRSEIFMGTAEVVGAPALTGAAASTTAAAAGTSWFGTAAVGTAATATAMAMQPSELSDGKVPATTAKPDDKAAVAKAASEKSADAKADKKKSENYKKAGEFCIFGGYASTYAKSKSNGRILCPAPAGAVNNTICKDTPAPNFLCQSMGLSENAKIQQVTNKLCVPLLSKEKGLANISARCADAFTNKFLPAVKGLSVEDLKAAQEKIKKGLAQLESEKGISGVGLLQYCDSKNSLNKELQSKPCEALQQIVSEFRKIAPNFAKQADAQLAANTASPKGKKPEDAVKVTK